MQEKAIIVFEDEASFRQSPTLHQTWAPLNSQPQIPSLGQRNTQKIFGAVCLYSSFFIYGHQEKSFNAETYIDFLDQVLLPKLYKRNRRIYLIHDNATYHKKPEVYDWFKKNRKKIEVFLLPRYCPEYNAAEQLWRYTRKHVTHNRYFDSVEELCASLFSTFEDIQKHPEKIQGLMKPFF